MKYYAKDINGEIKLFSGQKNGNVLAETEDSSLLFKKLKIENNNIVVDEAAQSIYESSILQKEIDKKYKIMRQERDRLLSETDYIMLPDYPLLDKSEYIGYRQQLRDLPSNIIDINNFTFPTKPGS